MNGLVALTSTVAGNALATIAFHVFLFEVDSVAEHPAGDFFLDVDVNFLDWSANKGNIFLVEVVDLIRVMALVHDSFAEVFVVMQRVSHLVGYVIILV